MRAKWSRGEMHATTEAERIREVSLSGERTRVLTPAHPGCQEHIDGGSAQERISVTKLHTSALLVLNFRA